MTRSVPKIAIGVPIFNGENFLRQALDAIAGQTFPDFEVFLCDNASTDGTAEICREFVERDPRFRYFPSDTNRGAAWNFNRPVEMCRSPYFIWAAHDDRWRPTLLEKCSEALDLEPEIGLCYPRSVFIDEQNKELWHFDARLHLRDPDPIKRFTSFVRRYAEPDFCNPVFGLYRMSVLRQVSVLPPYPGSDMVMMSEVALNSHVHEVPDVLFERRDHPKRSIRASPTNADVANWFLPGSGKKTQHVIRVWAYKLAEGVWRSKHPPDVKLQCYAALMRYYVAPQLPRYGRKLAQQALALPRYALSKR
jgi:glycosyltransferase involved in cell wall biosynthesis